MAKSLVVGLGIGRLYQSVLKNIGHQVITVDLNGSGDYSTVAEALKEHKDFSCSFVATPNNTHYSIARQVAPYSQIVFCEKPGFKFSSHWQSIQDEFPSTRFMMIKNNQYRDNIDELKQLAKSTNRLCFHWVNLDRVPNPGSWFTNELLSYGGVSRDLVPHLLSLVAVLNPNYKDISWQKPIKFQNWQLSDLTSTDYGQVYANGTYNVDDRWEITGSNRYHKVEVRADWRSLTHTDIGIHFGTHFEELGLCPESAYQRMIETAIANLTNNIFWTEQTRQDKWIMDLIQ
jgi:predicted dehydrogenase